MGKAQAKSKNPPGEQRVQAFMDFVRQAHLPESADALNGAALLAALEERLAELDQEIEKLTPAYEEARPKKGRPKGKWFDQGHAYSAWLLAHTVWARQNGYKISDFQVPKTATSRELIVLAKKIKWDNGAILPGGSGLFMGSEASIEQAIARGRKPLGINDVWQSEACEQIFLTLGGWRGGI